LRFQKRFFCQLVEVLASGTPEEDKTMPYEKLSRKALCRLD
jgi:hypothetical protein